MAKHKPAKRGRPKGTLYGKKVPVNVSVEDYDELKVNAKAMKITMSQWIRNTLSRNFK